MKRMDTLVLNNIFVLAQNLLIIFWSNQEAKQDTACVFKTEQTIASKQ